MSARTWRPRDDSVAGLLVARNKGIDPRCDGRPSFGAPRKPAAVATARSWNVPIYARGFWTRAFGADC